MLDTKSQGCGNMLNFYDFEVFKYDWLVVIINPEKRSVVKIANDREKLMNYYQSHKNEIWVGYNSSNYDRWILKAILCGFNPKKVNDFIILGNNYGGMYSNLMLQNFSLINYDVMLKMRSLKQLEAFMGNDIKETSVPFDIDRKLTKDEIEETFKYCTHDVEQTMEVFIKTKKSFDTTMQLVTQFNLPLEYVSKGQSLIVAKILGADSYGGYHQDDEFSGITFPDTLRLKKYSFVKDWYANKDNHDYSMNLECNIAGVPHVFAWGGVHGALLKYRGTGAYIMADVSSLYPSLMIRYNYFSRSVRDPERYIQIYKKNLEMKRTKDPMRPAYKLVCNLTYGCFKSKSNPLFDPLMANNICVAGQLLILDLIEHLEPVCKLIQSNTDGILIKYDDTDRTFERIDDIVSEWEERTGLGMEFTNFTKIFQGDVNNYVAIEPDGSYKSKGAYVKDLDDLDNDLAIVNKALVNRLVNNIPIRDTIESCNRLKDFQKIVHVTSEYKYGVWGNKRQNEKTFRVFASKNPKDGKIMKVKKEGANPEKFANTPEHCFIFNGYVEDEVVQNRLDKQWYIDLAEKRLKEKFGL